MKHETGDRMSKISTYNHNMSLAFKLFHNLEKIINNWCFVLSVVIEEKW